MTRGLVARGYAQEDRSLLVAGADIHELVLKDVRDLLAETGWGRVPTPIF